MNPVFAKLSRLAAVYQDVGLSGIASRLLHKVTGNPHDDAWLSRKREADAQFDLERGVQTGGIQEIRDLTVIGPNARYGIAHIASDPHHFVGMMRTINLDFSQYTFLDIGSGMGRAITLASDYPFPRLIGVEFAAELHQQAKENATRLPGAERIELVHADATTYEFPKEPLMVYMFNPFGSPLVRRVADRLLESWRASPRPILVLYAQPEHQQQFIAAGWQLTEGHGGLARFVPPER